MKTARPTHRLTNSPHDENIVIIGGTFEIALEATGPSGRQIRFFRVLNVTILDSTVAEWRGDWCATCAFCKKVSVYGMRISGS